MGMALAGAMAFLVALGLTPLVMWLTQWAGGRGAWAALPRTGGVVVVTAYGAAVAAMTYVPWLGGEEWGRRALWLVCLWPGVMLAMATGLLEDLVGLDGWTKGVGQVLAGLVAYWCGAARVETVAGWAAPEWLGVGLTVGWLVGAMHAMHLANGLAAGAPLGMAGGVVAAGLWGEADGVAAGAAPLAGALAGLLSGQVRAAKLLLGEGGSRAVGYLLGCYGLAWGQGGEAMERMGRLW